MIRNLKVLGLALVAVFAMSAVAASAASAANGVLTSTGPVTLVGDEDGTNALTGANGGVVTCSGSTVAGHKVGTTELIPSGSGEATLTPNYVNCLTALSGTNHKTTVTLNGCDYKLTIGATTAGGGYSVTADLVCPATKDVQVEVYPFAGSELGGVVCTITIQPQTGLTGPELTNVTGSPNDLTLAGAFTGIHSSQSGSGCTTESSTTDVLDVNYTVTGRNAEGNPTAISVSHS